MVTKNSSNPPAPATVATATAFAAPTAPSGPAAGIPAGDAAKVLAEQPAPQLPGGSVERAVIDTEQQTAAMAQAAQDEVERGKVAEAAKGAAVAAEIAATVPAPLVAPADGVVKVPAAGEVVTGDGSGVPLPPVLAPAVPVVPAEPAAPLEDPAAAMPASDDAAALQVSTAPVQPSPAAMPAVTGVGAEGVTTKSGRVFTGQLAALWTKLKEGATLVELRAASGIHDVESHLRRWEADRTARVTMASAPGGIVYQAKEQGEA